MTRHLVLVVAVAGAAACQFGSPADPSPPGMGSDGGAVFYTALGASDTTGYGGSVPCIPFVVCDGGTGYVQILARRFEQAGPAVSVSNLGIPGAVLSPEIEAIGDAIGTEIFANILERELPFVRSTTTAVTIFAGGNDANTVGSAVREGLGGVDPSAYITLRIANFGRDFRALIAGIRAKAPAARVVALNVPNLAALPYASGLSLTEKRRLQDIAVGFAKEINKLASDGVLVVDLMCDATFYQASIFSSDGFHPNDAGYAHMAEVTFGPLSTGATSPPQASCGRMTVF